MTGRSALVSGRALGRPIRESGGGFPDAHPPADRRGRRAGEGYWSPDGKRLVFQSEREPGNPFYQIYALDLTTGDTKRISPGYGKTTCSFFRPGTDEIEFASTHHDPTSKKQQQDELDFRASGKTRRYSWDYDPEFEIYVIQPGATPSARRQRYTRLTNARGYDAEGSYSPDGQWIVFTSMRDAYNRTLSAEEQKQLEVDPELLRRDLHHARRWLGPEAADQRRRLRRRPVLLSGRQADHLAPFRYNRTHRRMCSR